MQESKYLSRSFGGLAALSPPAAVTWTPCVAPAACHKHHPAGHDCLSDLSILHCCPRGHLTSPAWVVSVPDNRRSPPLGLACQLFRCGLPAPLATRLQPALCRRQMESPSCWTEPTPGNPTAPAAAPLASRTPRISSRSSLKVHCTWPAWPRLFKRHRVPGTSEQWRPAQCSCSVWSLPFGHLDPCCVDTS